MEKHYDDWYIRLMSAAGIPIVEKKRPEYLEGVNDWYFLMFW